MNRIKLTTFFAAVLTAASLCADETVNQFNTAKTAFDNKQYAAARTSFETFLNRYSTHTQAPAAAFYLAESLMYLGHYPQAENYFSRLSTPGLNDQYAKAALFRYAEIPYIQGQLDTAKQRLEDFVEKLPHDINLQFVLYYLGDIAMRSTASTAALEAEHYFGQADRIFPDGEKSIESKLGLAWAKNKLGKVTEANALYTQLMNNTNPAVVEQATYQYGTALFERGSFQDAVNTLTEFQRRYPASSYFADSLRVVVRCKGRLNDFESALQVLAQITQPNPDDLLMKVRCLYGLKQIQEAKTALDEAKRVAGTAYRDEIALLEAVFLSDKKDWRGVIALLESVLVPAFDALSKRMTVNYLSLQAVPGTRKLSEEGFFRACSLLALAYAHNRQPENTDALLNEMRAQAALSDNFRLTAICTDTANQLANISTVPNRIGSGSGGLLAGRGSERSSERSSEQWTPSVPSASNQGSGSRTPAVLTEGTDLTKFWRAEQFYQTKNYEAAARQLEQILSGFYNQISTPKQYNIHYNITGAEGTLNEATFARACSLLALSQAQLKDCEQANAILSTLASRIRMTDPVQENLLRETYDQLAVLATGGGTAGAVSLLSESDQRRLLRDANTMFRKQEYVQADAKLTELMGQNPVETLLTEALLLQGKAKCELGREQEGAAVLERIVYEFPVSKECPEALWFLGLYYESGGDSFQAVEYFQMLADKFPNYRHIDGALYFLAVDDLTNGNGRKAVTNLTRIHRNYRNGLYWSHAAWTLAYDAYKKRQYEQAEEYIQEILCHPPDRVLVDRVLYLKGELALRRSDHESAFLAFREVARLCPESPLCYHATRNAQLAAGKTVNITF